MTESTRSTKDRSILFGLQNLSSLTLTITNIRTPSESCDDSEDNTAQHFLKNMAAPRRDPTPPHQDELMFADRAYPPAALWPADDGWPRRPTLALYVVGLIIFFGLGVACALLLTALLL